MSGGTGVCGTGVCGLRSTGVCGPGSRGRAGLIAIAVSVAATFTVAALGPSVMEPALPGVAGQPPWAFAAHPPAVLAAGLAAVGLAAGALGLGLCLSALHRGWVVRPRPVLLAGLLAAAALALVPPFGSGDHLSYAAYGRMVVTGRDPYTTTPAMLARLGDAVARAVQDWRGSPSVYGSLASGLQALASQAGGTSARLTVFVLSLLNVAAFAATGLLLYRLARGSPSGQLRAALLWACNPLLLQVLVAGAHVDSQAVVFAVAAIAVFCLGLREGAPRAGPGSGSRREFAVCAAAGVLAGLGAAVKLTMILVLAGLLMATVLPGLMAGGAGRTGRPVRVRAVWVRSVQVRAGGLVAGFAAVTVVALVPWGPGALRPALSAGSMVSIGSPWRTVRLLLHLGAGEAVASHVAAAAAVLLAVVLLVLLVSAMARGSLVPGFGGDARLGPDAGLGYDAGLRPAGLAVACAFAFTFAWLMAWPYVLPWYDGLGWALLALLPVRWRGQPVRLVVALDWLMLARTTALGFGYLPARGITMPADLAWLRPVFRNAVTPLVLFITLLILLSLLRRPRRITDPDAPLSDTRVTG